MSGRKAAKRKAPSTTPSSEAPKPRKRAPAAKKAKAAQPEKKTRASPSYSVVRIEEKDQPDREYGTGETLRGFGVKFLKLPLNFDLTTIDSFDENKYGHVKLILKPDFTSLSLGTLNGLTFLWSGARQRSMASTGKRWMENQILMFDGLTGLHTLKKECLLG
jgi:hypothetical protein